MNPSRRFIAAAALVATLLALLASPAAAHTGFESSNPADGATVAAELDSIVLSFSGPAEPTGEGFVVLDPGGVPRAPDTVTPGPEQKVWTLGFDPPLVGGLVGVRWTVKAPDAHPIEGSFSFTVDAPTPSPEDAPAERAAVPPPVASDDQTTSAEAATPLPEPLTNAASTAATSTEDMEAFLAASEATVPNAAGVGAFGRILGFVGTMLGIGGLVFAVAVLRGRRGDTLAVLRLVRFAAVLVFVGTIIDLVAHLAVAGEGWTTMWTQAAAESVAASPYGIAVGLRSVSALLLLVSTAREPSFADRTPVPAQARHLATTGSRVTRSDLGPTFAADFDPRFAADVGWPEPPSGPELLGYSSEHDHRPANASMSLATLLVVVALLASFTFDGHTVTEGNRWITGAVDMVHVVAGAVWAGGVLAFAIVLWRRYRRRVRLDALELALRFSVIAGASLAAAGVAGTVLAIIILDRLSELWTTPWGLLLMAKFMAVAAAGAVGTFNHFIVIPYMEADPDDDRRSLLLRNTATGEAILLCVVLAVTAFLVAASSA